QVVDGCLLGCEFVKKILHGESPCAEGRLVNGMISLMIVSENTRVWCHRAELTGRHPAPCSW
ncbi:hypothetical protein ACWBEQ_005504, partial [Escherichia coli]